MGHPCELVSSYEYKDDLVSGDDVVSEAEMRRSIPLYSRKQVDAAGAMLISDELKMHNDFEQALNIINNWRSCHTVPLDIIRRALRNNSEKVDPKCLVAQRIKRLPSIAHKLQRFPNMKLCQMQDIGGCRVVLKNVQMVRQLLAFYKRSQTQNILVDVDDYVESPKSSGYRGVHLIYRYNSLQNAAYNKLKIEIQIRSQLQHAWATAVETVGTFVRQALKSSQGEEDWLRFFTLMGTAIALREKCRPVANTPIESKKLIEEIRIYRNRLSVNSVLNAFGTAVDVLPEESAKENAKYYLLHLDASQKKIFVKGFTKEELTQASQAYLQLERKISEDPASEAVLVSVDSLKSLRRAYPNYFLDTRRFIDAVNAATEE